MWRIVEQIKRAKESAFTPDEVLLGWREYGQLYYATGCTHEPDPSKIRTVMGLRVRMVGAESHLSVHAVPAHQ